MQESNQGESKRLTKADWKAIFDEWKASGMRQQQFCETKGIKLHTFSYWRSQLVEKKKQISSFHAVNVKSTSKALSVTQPVSLRLPNGISLTIPATADKVLLKNLFELLDIKAC